MSPYSYKPSNYSNAAPAKRGESHSFLTDLGASETCP